MLNFYQISINTCAMIGQLSRPYLTVRLAKFKTLFKLKSSSSIWTRKFNKYLSNSFFSGCTVSYELGYNWRGV